MNTVSRSCNKRHGLRFLWQGEPRTAPIIFLRSFMLSGPNWFMMPGIISLTSAMSRRVMTMCALWCKFTRALPRLA